MYNIYIYKYYIRLCAVAVIARAGYLPDILNVYIRHKRFADPKKGPTTMSVCVCVCAISAPRANHGERRLRTCMQTARI